MFLKLLIVSQFTQSADTPKYPQLLLNHIGTHEDVYIHTCHN